MMKNTTKNEVVSTLRIEPVNTNEYNRSLVVLLTSHHKQTFLQCIRSEPNFLYIPEAYPNLCEKLTTELNRQKRICSQSNWLKIFRAWTNIVSNSPINRVRSKEDTELLELISVHQAMSSHRVDTIPEQQTMNSLLTHCRVCLASSSSKMIFLFNDRPEQHRNIEDATLLEKLNYCSCFMAEASADDGLPQYICMSCSILIENAYQLKVLCAKTEARLHELQQLSAVQCDVRTEEPSKIPDALVNDVDSKEINEHHDNVQWKENDQTISKEPNSEIPGQYSPRAKTEVVADVDLIETDNMNGLEEFLTMKKKPPKPKCDEYTCEYCSKQFRVKNSLAIHMRAHTNERPYSCGVCGKAFKTSSAANNHRVVHAETKDVQCSQCPFRTNTKSNLRIHERTHTRVQPYTCKICAMKFRTASNAVKHMRNIHEKQNRNQCDKCSRSFFTRESLRKHSIVHTGMKPFDCPICSLSYAWYNGLKKHIQAHHSHENIKLATEKCFFDRFKNSLP